jgi:hypothetical protein
VRWAGRGALFAAGVLLILFGSRGDILRAVGQALCAWGDRLDALDAERDARLGRALATEMKAGTDE